MINLLKISGFNCSKNVLKTFSGRRSLFVGSSSSQNETNSSANNNEEPSILVEKDGNITLIGINREKHRNSIDGLTAQKLSEVIFEFESDKTSPVAVLYGVGGNFCAGNDINELEKDVEANCLDFLLRHEGSVGPTRRHLRKPVICSISGFCVAGGLELALLCDMRVMEESACLGFFNRRLGVPISDGGTVRLAAMVGFSRAVDIITTGRKLTGKEAFDMGLVNRLVATGSSLGQAVNLAFCIAKFPMASLLNDRSALLSNVNIYERPGFQTYMQNEIMNTSKEIIEEMREGVKRYRNSTEKGPRTGSFEIKEKYIPDWEKAEIEIEKDMANAKLYK